MGAWRPLTPVTWFLGLEVLHRLRGVVLDSMQHDFNLRDWMDAREPVTTWQQADEVWFDFIADIGDGNRAMASVAYHLQRPITITDGVPTDAERSHVAPNGFAAPCSELPRGAFLFVGGDYAYPASDVRTMWLRVFEPFAKARIAGDASTRPIYGIPANHDYYDDLIGFNRTIRKPLAPDHEHAPATIAGFRQEQSASYVRIVLPHQWELWGVDVGSNGIDFRQLVHLRPDKAERPKRLIVCTQTPPIVIDHDETAAAHRDALCLLRLSGKFDTLASSPREELGDHLDCRLDLSGDVHHYARYGAEMQSTPVPAHQFAGVVSGGGGAFLHPTQFAGEIPAKRKYPTPEQCVQLLAPRLLSFFHVARSGHAWLLAGLLALAVYAAAPRWIMSPPTDDIALGIALVVMLAGPLAWFLAIRPRLLGQRIVRRKCDPPDATSFRSSVTSWAKEVTKAPVRDLLDRSQAAGFVWVTFQIAVVFACLLLPPSFAIHHHPAPSARGVLGIVAALFLVGGGAALAVAVGSGRAPGIAGKLGFLVLGLIHGAIQLALPLAILVYASTTGIAVSLGICIASALAVIAVAKLAPSRWPLRIVGSLVWIGQAIAMLLVLAHFGAHPIDLSLTLERGALAMAIGIVVCIHQLGWYLFVAFSWGGHNNEAGAAIRSERFKQFIRFHLDKHGVLTGYVIGVDDAVDVTQRAPVAKLVDVFQMKPPA